MSKALGAHGTPGATTSSGMTGTAPTDPFAGTDATLNARVRRRRRSGWARTLGVAILAAAIAFAAGFAVGRTGPGGTAPEHAGTAADTVVVGLKLAPVNLDIRRQSGNAVMQLLIGNVYEGLVGRDSHNRVVPAIADSWDIAKDGLAYTFHLRQGLTFSNGDVLDATDVVWSIRQMIERQYYDYEQLDGVTSVEALDDHTVRLTLDTPNANLLWYLSARPGLVFDQDAHYDPKTQAVGSGPYLVSDFVPNDSVTLTANPNYTGRNPAKTHTVVVRYLTDANAAVNALTSGTVQVLSPIDEQLAAPLKNDPAYTIRAGNGSDKYVLAMNNRRAPFTDKRVRQAIRYAIDHKQIIAARGGADQPLGGPIPAVDPGYRDLTGLYPHDVAKAQELMRQAGYGPDHHLTTTLTYANTYGTELGDQLRSQLAAIWIDLKIDYVEFSTWLTDVHQNADYDLSLVDHAESHDFEQWADPTYYYGYDNPRVQELYRKAMAATDEKTTDRLLAQAARQVSEDAAADWLFAYRVTTATAQGVSGFAADLSQSFMPLWNLTYVRPPEGGAA